jgi:hypothetical protein
VDAFAAADEAPVEWLRSLAVPCCRRGNHASGAVMVRPSENSTSNVSAVTFTFSPATARGSATKVFMPFSQQLFAILVGHHNL